MMKPGDLAVVIAWNEHSAGWTGHVGEHVIILSDPKTGKHMYYVLSTEGAIHVFEERLRPVQDE